MKKRLFFLTWSGENLGLTDVIFNLKNCGYEILYWTGLSKEMKEVKVKLLPGTIFHDHYDAFNGIPPEELADNNFPPPGEELLKKLSATELDVLTMMNKHFEGWSVSKRKRLYYNHVRYWHGVLRKFNPDVILYTSVPHAIYDYIVYSLAELLNIKTIALEPSWVSDRLLLIKDFKKGCEAITEGLAENANKHFQLLDLSSDLQEYYRLQSEKVLDTTPIFVKHTKSQYTGWRLMVFRFKIIWASVKSLTLLSKFFRFFKKALGKNIIKEYHSIQGEADLAKKFVYFPLKYQPERTSSPQGGVFVDHLLVAELLSVSLPEDWLVYVKEHPLQWMLHGLNYTDYRYPGFYEAFSKIQNIRIVPAETSTYDLINAAKAVATLPGTAGLEAVFRGKPVLSFGYFWYQDFPGMFKVLDFDSCKGALEEIESGFSFSSQQVIDYLGVFDKISFHGYVDMDGTKVSQLRPQDNTVGIFNALIKEL